MSDDSSFPRELDPILRLSGAHAVQMRAIRERVAEFAAERGWQVYRRGRHGNACMFGEVNGLSGVLNIEADFEKWDDLPEKLQPSTVFTVFASVFRDVASGRETESNPLSVTTTFADVNRRLDEFLARGWAHLQSRTEADLVPPGSPDSYYAKSKLSENDG